MKIPFNRPSFTGKELAYIREAVLTGQISGDGFFTQECCRLMEKKLHAKRILLTPSGTSALELAAVLLNLRPGDEVLVPSYTFTSTANAFMLRGAKPVFVDIREDTKNIDERLIRNRITRRTKAIFVVHYAGVACEMKRIQELARKYHLVIVEDAAQALNSKYEGEYLGTLGTFGCYSFHETKNVISGEGGALVINHNKYISTAEIIREKGTNRTRFFRGEINKYRWLEVGGSFLISDVLAAFLFAQLENIEQITQKRKRIFERYSKAFQKLAERGDVTLPVIPENCTPNYHMFYFVLNKPKTRTQLIEFLKKRGILSVFHYLPLHISPVGLKLGHRKGDFPVTEHVSACLLRLPFFNSMREGEQNFVIQSVNEFFVSKK